MSLFFSDAALRGQDIAADGEGNQFFDDAAEQVYGCVGDDGFVAVLKPEVYDISYSYSEPTVHIYHPCRADDLSDEYALADGACSVRDAVDFVNDWLQTAYQPLSPDYAHEVETVIVREHEGQYLFEILVRALFQNVPLDSYTQECGIADGARDNRLKYTNYGIQIQMVKAGEIASFTNLCGIFQPTETETLTECISLRSALQHCAETFTDFRNVTVSDIFPMYTVEPEYEEPEPDRFVLTGYHSRPVWALVIDAEPQEYLKHGEINTYGDIRKYIYADMLTGELSYNFEIVLRR